MIKVKWPKIIDVNLVKIPRVEWINLCNGNMFQIYLFTTSETFFSEIIETDKGKECNIIIHPRNGLFVGIDRLGCFLFTIDNALHWEYVSKKLYIPEPDARVLADFLNIQLDKVFEDESQQGKYDTNYMKGSNSYEEYYGLIGENKQKIIEPEIIN